MGRPVMPKYGTVSQVLLQLVVALPCSQGLDKFKLFEPIKLICVFVKISTNQRRQGSDSDSLVCLKVIFKSKGFAFLAVSSGFSLTREENFKKNIWDQDALTRKCLQTEILLTRNFRKLLRHIFRLCRC